MGTVAIASGNGALAELLADIVRQQVPKIAQFGTIESLTTFMRISPVYLLVLDTDLTGRDTLTFTRGLRASCALASPYFSLVGITRVQERFHRPFLAAGFDEVFIKPLLANKFLARITELNSNLERHPQAPSAPVEERYDNVIPLFPIAMRGRVEANPLSSLPN